MKIGEVSQNTGVSQRMIRHFESLDLISPNRMGSYRDYSKDEERLIFKIRELQGLGLSLNEIKTILDNPEQKLEHSLLDSFSRNKKQIEELERVNSSIVNSIQSISLSSSIENLLEEGLIMKFVESFEENHLVRGRLPYLEVFYETFVSMSEFEILHSTDLVDVSQGVSVEYDNDLKIVVSSTGQQYRSAFIFFLSPELAKKISGEVVNSSTLSANKEQNLALTKWLDEAIKTFGHAWTATFTKLELENYGMLKSSESLKSMYHNDELLILTNIYTKDEKERFSVALPYRYISIVYDLLKR